MDVRNLLQFGQPSAHGQVRADEWAHVESMTGQLPADYKSLVSLFGFGAFGSVVFFHPFARRASLLLPTAETEYLKLLTDNSRGLRDFLRQGPRIVGFGPERHLVAHAHGEWSHIDFELDQVSSMGRSLIEFLHLAYSTRAFESAIPIAKAIWSDNDPFFSSAVSL